MTPLVEVSNLSVSVQSLTGSRRLVNDVSFAVEEGEIFGIAGESGSGKTMTCSALIGLTPERTSLQAEQLRVNGIDLLSTAPERIRGSEIAMIFQDPAAALNPVFSVSSQIDAVLRAHTRLNKKSRRQRIRQALEDVGLPDPERTEASFPHQLSGGMQQRVLIAMALSAGAKLLIADEPTTALDVTVQSKILALLKSLRDSRNLTILFVSHDLAVLSQLCDRVAVMLNGTIVETGAVKQVLGSPSHAYTRALLAALPGRHSRGQPLPTVESNLLTGESQRDKSA